MHVCVLHGFWTWKCLAESLFSIFSAVQFGFRRLCKLSCRGNRGRAQACSLLDPVCLWAVVEGCPLYGLKETGAGLCMFMYVCASKNRGSVLESHGRPYFLFSLSKFTSQRKKGRGRREIWLSRCPAVASVIIHFSAVLSVFATTQ